ncbi:hypothetical protein LTR53_017397, partial [Teratosphaeriaceae sp. CCFEE 6253]
MKCLPHVKLEQAKGNVLHDWHGEILALRAFNLWLVDECAALAGRGSDGEVGEGSQGTEMEWVRWRSERERTDGVQVRGSASDDSPASDVREPDDDDNCGENQEPREYSSAAQHTPPFALRPDVQIH